VPGQSHYRRQGDSQRHRHVVNRAATAFRLAATTLLRSQSYLGAQYRRLRGKLDSPKAPTAMAHRLARLVYRLLRWGHEYVDKGLTYYEARHREQQVQLLTKRAAKLGLQIIEPEMALIGAVSGESEKTRLAALCRSLLIFAGPCVSPAESGGFSVSPYAGLCRPLPAFAAVKGQEKGNVPGATPRNQPALTEQLTPTGIQGSLSRSVADSSC
jgi:hypothetical protein